MDEGTINTGIARSTRDRVKMAVSDDPFARQAITTFKVLERFDSTRFDDGYTLVECHLFTGRTHQIRVHMRHINHACVGDPLYGKCDARADQRLTRQFLHSWRVAFDHPVTGSASSAVTSCRGTFPRFWMIWPRVRSVALTLAMTSSRSSVCSKPSPY